MNVDISKHTLDVCPHCGSKDLDYLKSYWLFEENFFI